MKHILIALALISILATACQTTSPPSVVPTLPGGSSPQVHEEQFDPEAMVETRTFDSEAQFKAFFTTYGGGSYYGGGIMARGMGVAETAGAPMMDAAAGEGAKAPSPAHSDTNVQIQGVDEGDIIKTDGNHIYTVSGKTLFIIKAYPGEDAEIIDTIELDSAPSGLFIQGDRLAVFGDYYNLDYFKEIDFVPRQGMTFFDIYDISDKDDAKLEKELKFEGTYFRSRMAGDWAYFLVSTMPDYRRPHPLPMMIEGTTVRNMPIDDVRYFNIPYGNPTLVSVHAINLDDLDEDVNSKSVVVEGSPDLFMGLDNIYVTYTEYINEWDLSNEIMQDLLRDELTEDDTQLIIRIQGTPAEILSKYEKQQKILEIYQSYVNYMDTEDQEDLQDEIDRRLKERLAEYEHLEFTIINRLSYAGGIMDVESNGKVPGHIMNQFSMDENDDVFRIATTISPRWTRFTMMEINEQPQSTNNVYTLDADLDVLGELEDLAPGEQIYSTRFIDDRLYMVTFRQVDPFFVIDLSDPTDPETLGDLKIPGFSRYLHPYDENTIIGIGEDASETGRTRGLKISLFDVSDVTKPKELAKFVTEEKYASSTALYEHKAFLFDREKELLVIPVYSYEYLRDGTYSGYNGAFVFKMTPDDIELRGLIDHSKAPGASNYYYSPQVQRSLFIEDELYTLSPTLLRINDLGTLKGIKDIELRSGTGDIKVY